MELKNLILMSSAMVLLISSGASCHPGTNWKILSAKQIDQGQLKDFPLMEKDVMKPKDQVPSDIVQNLITSWLKSPPDNTTHNKTIKASFTLEKSAEEKTFSLHKNRIESHPEVLKIGPDLETIISAESEADEDLLDGLKMILNRNETLEDVFKSEKFSGF